MQPRIAIIDYGMGNLRSIKRGLEQAGARAIITADKKTIEKADAVVLPGVGAFCDAIANLAKFNEVIKSAAREKPMLGVCLGMQLLFEESEEGGRYKGLGLMKGRVVRLPAKLKVPQMGWNRLKIRKKSRLLEGIKSRDYFYFVHSYYATGCEEVTVATTKYGVDVPAIVEKGSLFGTQFHPEKSGAKGLQILRNFVELAKSYAGG